MSDTLPLLVFISLERKNDPCKTGGESRSSILPLLQPANLKFWSTDDVFFSKNTPKKIGAYGRLQKSPKKSASSAGHYQPFENKSLTTRLYCPTTRLALLPDYPILLPDFTTRLPDLTTRLPDLRHCPTTRFYCPTLLPDCPTI